MNNRGTVNLTQIVPPRAAEQVKRKAKRGAAPSAPLAGALSDATLSKLSKLKEDLKTTTGKR